MRQHWYCLSYVGKSLNSGHDCSVSVYVGYPNEGMTLVGIEKNKEVAGVTNKAVLVACSYLGYMTHYDFTGKE